MDIKQMNRAEYDNLEADELTTKFILIALVMAAGILAAVGWRLL